VKRRALVVGINTYDYMEGLSCCLEDALAMQRVLAFHENHDPNFACRVLLGRGQTEDGCEPEPGAQVSYERVTFNSLRRALEELFAFDGMVVFYFSGHGYPDEQGVFLVTQDGNPMLPGILLNDVLRMANESPAREIVLIIDSCFSGALGEPERVRELADLHLRPGVTLLAASMAAQQARELNGHGVFTHLVLGALKGGASDVRGQISAASIYAYVEQALGPWDQRPIYKSNASQLSTIRYFTPDVSDEELRRLPRLFPRPDHHFFLDPSYEVTCVAAALPEHIRIFKLFKRYQVARLLRPVFDEDLYFAALRGHPVALTPLGQFYWQLARNHLLGGSPQPVASRRFAMPNAEAVAKLFHETYERLAPAFGYETREATRVPWDRLPECNKNLMIAATAEVLAMLYPSQEAPTSTSAPDEHAAEQESSRVGAPGSVDTCM
jgi:hypothetical protein